MIVTNKDIQKLRIFEEDFHNFMQQKQEFEKYKTKELQLVNSKFDELENREKDLETKRNKLTQVESELERAREQLDELKSKCFLLNSIQNLHKLRKN